MKVFISVPMRDKTEEEVKKEIAIVTNIAKAYFPEENALGTLEFVDNSTNYFNNPSFSFIRVTPPEDDNKKPLYSLGEALQKLSNCDAIICPYRTRTIYEDSDTTIEHSVALDYDIDVYEYDDIIFRRKDKKPLSI